MQSMLLAFAILSAAVTFTNSAQAVEAYKNTMCMIGPLMIDQTDKAVMEASCAGVKRVIKTSSPMKLIVLSEAKRAGRAVTMDLIGSSTETGLEVKSVLLH